MWDTPTIMAKRSTSASEDADRLEEELPAGVTAPLKASVRLLEDSTRLGLEATLWPFRIMPRLVRDGLAQGLRAGVAASAMVPHALGRAVSEAADRFLDRS